MRRPYVFILLGMVSMISETMGDTLDQMVERTMPLKTHSIAAPYVDSDLQNRWWDFGADAIVNTNKHIRLTQDRPSQSGWLWSRIPLSVVNFEIEIEFKVDGKAHNMFGDGFAIWFTKERATFGPVFGSADKFTGLGIFFDTYANAKHSYKFPRVTAMLGDGQAEYDNGHDNAAGEVAGCSENFRRRDIPTKARVSYIKGRILQVKLQVQKEDEWVVCFETDQITLPSQPYLGFSALTGDVSDNHDIISVTASTLQLSKEYRDTQAPFVGSAGSGKGRRVQPRSGSSAAGWFLFILKIIGCLAFVAFVFAAYRTYSAQQSRRAW